MNGLYVAYGLSWSRTANGASIWPSSLPAMRRRGALAGAAIPGVRMAKPLVALAHAILNESGYQYHIRHRPCELITTNHT
eukprot:6184523-Pleurochrysis_carterae.AAC.2